MGDVFIPIADILQGVGLTVIVTDVNAGWERRARGSGGFPGMPLGVQWHHTASSTSPESDVSYCVNGQDNPIGNVLLDRQGCYWPIAGGAANTAGKGGPLSLSRGTVAKDNANATTFAIEAANNGIGESWPQVQIDAYFAGSNALNAYFGNQPSDVFSHALGAGDGWTDRKIDPATCNVEGPWVPRSVNSSGTWSLADIRAECMARAGGYVPPIPVPPEPQPVPPSGDDWWTAVMYWLPVLTPGMSGIQVLRMQHLMCAVGAMNEKNTANYDGVFGSGTTNALNSFKVSAGGSADSTCDGWTWGALMHTIDGIPNLKKGDSGPDVKRMQHLLAANGYMNPANMSNYDGQWGNGTDNAKASFDRDHGLGGSDTSCGSKSWESLLGGTVW